MIQSIAWKVVFTDVPLLCHVLRSDQLQILDFLHGAQSNFRAGWLPASH